MTGAPCGNVSTSETRLYRPYTCLYRFPLPPKARNGNPNSMPTISSYLAPLSSYLINPQPLSCTYILTLIWAHNFSYPSTLSNTPLPISFGRYFPNGHKIKERKKQVLLIRSFSVFHFVILDSETWLINTFCQLDRTSDQPLAAEPRAHRDIYIWTLSVSFFFFFFFHTSSLGLSASDLGLLNPQNTPTCSNDSGKHALPKALSQYTMQYSLLDRA